MRRESSCQLAGKVAVITGASRGIGRATARRLADAGARVVLVSRTASELEMLAAEITGRGGEATSLVLDVSDRAAVDAGLGTLERIDILVNSAGVNAPRPIIEVSEEQLELLLAVNVKGTFRASQMAARSMLARGQGGAIVNLSSQMGKVGYPGRSVYCATKHAVEGMTKAMAVELAPHAIRVNAVAPTFVETAMTEAALAEPAFKQDVLARIPLGRIGTADEVSAAILFLCSPAASLITGASLSVDGGWTAL